MNNSLFLLNFLLNSLINVRMDSNHQNNIKTNLNMNKKKILLLLIPMVLVASFSFVMFQHKADQKEKNKVLTQLLFRSLQQAHFNMRDVNDDFSHRAFELYLKSVDGNKRFLTQADVSKLKAFELSMDDELKAGNSEMLKVSYAIIEQRLKEAKDYCMAVLDKPFDFSIAESFETDSDKRAFAKDESELKEIWRKSLKYQALIRYENRIATQEKKKEKGTEDGKNIDLKTNAQIEEEVRKQLVKDYNNVFDALGRLDEDDRSAEYLNAMMNVFDPHTEYYPPEDKDNFDIRMSGKLEGIGAQLQQVDGEIKVSRIVPGSPSWKGKQLKEGDVILKVAQGEEEPVAVSAMPLKDAVQLIRGKKGTEVRLTVKKADGLINVIPIIRDVIILEENFAKSAVIQDATKKKTYGYIKLPSFYADFSRSGGRNSGKDVELELEKLKKQGVDGMILDLRFNGGGSLADAVKMSGLFIEEGPIVQVKTKLEKTNIHEDEDDEIQYNGPLVVLVNKFSASASEILAGALQDYGRAVIVGAPSTYGKGTVQRFVPLDYYLPVQYQSLKPLGSLKLTIQKFYRITGKSTQWKGVEPDIILPDVYSYWEGEKDVDNALPWDEISPVKFDKWEHKLNVKKLEKSSLKRVASNDVMQLIDENAARLKARREHSNWTLNYEQYKAEQEKLKEEAKKFENVKGKHEDWTVKPLAGNVANDAMKEQRKALNDDWKKEIKGDEVIFEATNILDDIMSMIK